MARERQTFITVLICSTLILGGFIAIIDGSRCLLNRCRCTPLRVTCDQLQDKDQIRFTGAERMEVKYVVLTWNAKGLLDKACRIFPKLVEVYINPGINDDKYIECDSLPDSCNRVEVSCL